MHGEFLEGEPVMDETYRSIVRKLFDAGSKFSELLAEIFEVQRTENKVYRTFVSSYFHEHESPESVDQVPLLPIRAFKESRLLLNRLNPEIEFKSSGTGNHPRSRHFVYSTNLYRKSIHNGFDRYFKGDPFTLLCYAPGYSNNPDSSLLWMMKELIQSDSTGKSRFLPLDSPLKQSDVDAAVQGGSKILLFGAAFGLLDLVDLNSVSLPKGSQIIETGGMKTYRRTMTKGELRTRLSEGFRISPDRIHSEYGMCELMSQMYAIGGEWFEPQPWVHVSVRDPRDPFRVCEPGEEGKIAIIDLANLFSCPFLLTDDRGVADGEGRFSVRGRWHGAELRGCNFLLEQD